MRAVAALFALLLLSGTGVLAQKNKPTGEEGRLLALESAWNHAEQSKDAHAMEQLLAETFVYVDYDGTLMNRKQYLSSVMKNKVQDEQINNDGMTVRLYGNAAVVTGAYRDKGVEKGKPFVRRGRFTDTWINDKGTWRCVASQSTLITN
jgi:hypothetical protein